MKYELKDSTVEVIQYTGDNYEDVCKFVGYHPNSPIRPEIPSKPIMIDTPYGLIPAYKTDYIIRDPKGKHFLRTEANFNRTYKPLEEREST